MKKIYYCILLLSLMISGSINGQNIYTVTKTTDPDPFDQPYNYNDALCDTAMYGTLQWAIRKANDSPDSSIINFNIPGAGLHTIILNNYLPCFNKQIKIDGSTQPVYNYATGPLIAIDGSNLPYDNICFYIAAYAEKSEIKALLIKNFYACNGILVWCPHVKIIDNMFWNDGGVEPGYYGGMALYIASPYCIVQGNIFGTDITGTVYHGCSAGSIYLTADNCLIGGSGVNESNLIEYTGGRAGITIVNGKYNRISRNRIYDNNRGIILVIYGGPTWWGNEGKPEPIIILAVSSDTYSPYAGKIFGTSEAGDEIEIFKSTGEDNATEYLTTVFADANGNWNTTFANILLNDRFIATATDAANNTSEFSNSYIVTNTCPVVELGNDTTINAGQNVTLNAGMSLPGYAYQWDTGETTASITVTPTETTTFYLTVTDQVTGCSDLDSVSVNIMPIKGSSCENAFEIPPDTICNFQSFYIMSGNTEYWLKFIADTFKYLISINSQNNVSDVYLYDGNCTSLSLFNHSTAADSLSINLDNTTLGKEYYIKITSLQSNGTIFNICLKKCLNKTYDDHLCPPTCANIIPNPEFEVFNLNPSNWDADNEESPFYFDNIQSSLVCGWQSAWGSPQIEFNNPTSDAWMWAAWVTDYYHPNGACKGEGICSNININTSETYALSLNFYQSLTPMSQFCVVLAKSTNFWPTSKQSGGDWFPLNLNFNTQPLITLQTSSIPNSWTTAVVSFTANNNYDWIVIYPLQSPQHTGQTWLHIDNVEVIPVFPNAGPDQTICDGGSATLTLSSNSGSYIWSTGETTSSITVSPHVTTTYTVTLSYSNGCSTADEVVVTVNSLPNSNFTFNNYQCMTPYNVTFHPADYLNTSYSWSFGDGNTSTQMVPTPHTYALPGQYSVTLTVQNSYGCTTSTTQVISITPTAAGYNEDCCSESYPWNITGVDYTIPGNYYFPSTHVPDEGAIKGTVTIWPGAILNIDDCTIHFGPYGKIIVMPGAVLKVINSTLTGIECPDRDFVMWQGIEVWGDASKSHSLTNQIYQGKVYLEKATILNAHNAVVLGKPNGSGFYTSYSGGIIDASSDVPNTNTFKGNAVSIKFAPFYYPECSKIENCTFDGLPNSSSSVSHIYDPGYHYGNTAGYLYTNQYNLNYAPANWKWRSPYTNYLSGIRNLKYYGNTFKYAEIAINSTNSSFIVGRKTSLTNGNAFTQLTDGIQIKNSLSSPFYSHQILYNNFNNISRWSIYIGGGKSDLIKNNTFGTIFSNQNDNLWGVYLINSGGFSILDNTFSKYMTGILSYTFSPTATAYGGLIGYESTGNQFFSCFHSIKTGGDNSFLQIHCDRFIPSTITNLYYKNWYIGDKLADQGDVSNPTYDGSGAGNRYQISPLKEIYSDLYSFDYVHYTLSITIPIPQGTTLSAVPFLINNNKPFNISTSCALVPCNDPPCATSKLAELSDKTDSLQAEFIQVYNNLDNGEKAVLLDAINSYNNSGQLKSLLVNNSPLSDEVILAYISRTKQVTPGHFKEVMIPNSPVSDDVLPLLNNKLATLPPGIANQIKAAQGYNPAYRTPSAISRDIASVKNKRQLILNDAIIYYIDNDSLDAAVSMLEAENTVETNTLLLDYYLSVGDTVSAKNKLDIIPQNNQENIELIALSNIELDLLKQGKTEFDIDSLQEQIIRTIAAGCPENLATTHAKAILSLVFNESDTTTCDITASYKDSNEDTYDENITKSFYLSQNVPNPFSDITTINYILPENCMKAKLNIYDIMGREIETFELNSETNNITITANEFSEGMYLYGLELDGTIIEYKKLIRLKND